ncbi:SDR family oxidoreductase [Pseudomonas fluorescens]|uniref:SDR family oxidoreductase n=1 Tax=Pseudomonas fluorescens TaxID=294 RepID=UPI00398FFE9D
MWERASPLPQCFAYSKSSEIQPNSSQSPTVNSNTTPEETVQNLGANPPLGRPGQPVEVAPIYVLLASDEGSYITGQRFGVTGGKPIL